MDGGANWRIVIWEFKKGDLVKIRHRNSYGIVVSCRIDAWQEQLFLIPFAEVYLFKRGVTEYVTATHIEIISPS